MIRRRRKTLSRLFGAKARHDADHHDALPRIPQPWNDAELDLLSGGGTVFRHGEGNTDTGLAAVVVDAPAELIWQQITDFDAYVRFLPYITDSRRVEVARGGRCQVMDADFQITTKGVVTRYQVRHWWYRERGYMPFRMVTNESGGAVRGGQGFWQISRWDRDWSKNLLLYEVRLETSRLVPRFIKKLAANRGLPTAATLMARRAESAQRE